MRSLPVLCVALAACLPEIPRKSIEPRASLAPNLPALQPCVLVHGEGEESLSNGAHGWFRGPWKIAYTSFLVRHPKGLLLVDASFGETAGKDLDDAPFFLRWNFDAARKNIPIARLLTDMGIKPEEVTHVLLTHAHWDHTGGLAQLPNAKILLGAGDLEAIAKGEGMLVDGGIPRHFDGLRDRLVPLTFPGPAWDGFAASQDVFGDGSVVAVPAIGHTRGSTSWYVTSGDGHRWLFVGDAAWVKEGFEEPVTKGRLASYLADFDRPAAAEVLGRLHAIHEAKAATIVTSHDERTWVDVPRCSHP